MYGEDLIIYKFGGVVLQDEEKVVNIIKDGIKKFQKVIVVVSAIGRLYSPYSTDTLYSMCSNVSAKEISRIVSCGEIISSVLVSDLLRKNNVNAISLSLHEISLNYDNGFEMNDYIKECLKDYDVAIVPGFLGLKNGEIVLLPRGGSNITASYLASYFNSELIIFTDVDGIYMKDPKENISETKLNKITYDTLKEITRENQKLFPLEGIKYLEDGNVKVLIRNLDSDDGTIIERF